MPELQFLADMNISPLTVAQLKELGWDIMRVSDVLDKKTKDVEILAYGRTYNRILITQDLDFSMLLAVQGHTKPSVISLRLDNPTPALAATRVGGNQKRPISGNGGPVRIGVRTQQCTDTCLESVPVDSDYRSAL